MVVALGARTSITSFYGQWFELTLFISKRKLVFQPSLLLMVSGNNRGFSAEMVWSLEMMYSSDQSHAVMIYETLITLAIRAPLTLSYFPNRSGHASE